jgi:dihydrofolate reductase
MRKIILDLAVTLDGFIEGPNGEIDWCSMDDGDGLDFIDFINSIDTIFYGRVSYELWGNYQPPENANSDLKEVYKAMLGKTKYVFSATKATDDTNAIFIQTDIKERVMQIKQQPGKDIWLYGGGKLITSLLNMGLVDVLRLAVHPVILASGKPLFNDIQERIRLKSAGMQASGSGVILLTYEVTS